MVIAMNGEHGGSFSVGLAMEWYEEGEGRVGNRENCQYTSETGIETRDRHLKSWDENLRFCLYESFLFLTLLDVVAAGTGAAPLAMPEVDELDRCQRVHPSYEKGHRGGQRRRRKRYRR